MIRASKELLRSCGKHRRTNGSFSRKRFLRSLRGCSVQVWFLFLFSLKGNFDERCDSHITSRQRLDAASTVSVLALRERARVRGIGLSAAPGAFRRLKADLENVIRVIQSLARKLSEDHLGLTLLSCVSPTCSSHNNGFKTGGYSLVHWLNEEHNFTTTMPSEIYTCRMAAMSRFLQEQASDSISRAQLTAGRETIELSPGTWVVYFRRGKVTPGVIGAPSTCLRLGSARVIMTESVQQWSRSVHCTTANLCRLDITWKQNERSWSNFLANDSHRIVGRVVSWTIRRFVYHPAKSR